MSPGMGCLPWQMSKEATGDLHFYLLSLYVKIHIRIFLNMQTSAGASIVFIDCCLWSSGGNCTDPYGNKVSINLSDFNSLAEPHPVSYSCFLFLVFSSWLSQVQTSHLFGSALEIKVWFNCASEILGTYGYLMHSEESIFTGTRAFAIPRPLAHTWVEFFGIPLFSMRGLSAFQSQGLVSFFCEGVAISIWCLLSCLLLYAPLALFQKWHYHGIEQLRGLKTGCRVFPF